MYDAQENLEELFSRVDGVSISGSVPEAPDTFVLRDAFGTTQFTAPNVGTNPLRLNDASSDNIAGRVVMRNASGHFDTEQITLGRDPTASMDAATKSYVDARIAQLNNQINNLSSDLTTTNNNLSSGLNQVQQEIPTIVSGHGTSASFTHIIGQFNDSTNFFDVFPPAGKTMNDLIAFIPSVRYLHYNGEVDDNDSTRCVYDVLPDRIRVRVQNTEQRGRPSANYLGVWR
jgi:hypothetical protein